MLIGIGTQPTRVIQATALADAHAGFVGGKVIFFDKAYIVGRHQRRAELVGQRYSRMHMLFIVDPIGALHFQVETLWEHRHPLMQQGFCRRRLTTEQGMPHLTFLGAGQGNQAFGCGFDPVTLNDHQIIALPFAPATRNQLGEVAVTLGIHCQQGHTAQWAVFFSTRQPDIGTADRFDTTAHGRLIELHQRTHIAHVGDRHRRHTGRRH